MSAVLESRLVPGLGVVTHYAYVGDIDPWIGHCKHGDYSTGKRGTPGQAEGSLRDHYLAKHGEPEVPK